MAEPRSPTPTLDLLNSSPTMVVHTAIGEPQLQPLRHWCLWWFGDDDDDDDDDGLDEEHSLWWSAWSS